MFVAVNSWRLRSGDANGDRELPVEVRWCPLRSRAGKEEEKKKENEEEEEEEEKQRPLIKFNDLHLATREKPLQF